MSERALEGLRIPGAQGYVNSQTDAVEQPDLDSEEEEEEEELSRYFSSMNGNGTLSRAVRIKCEPVMEEWSKEDCLTLLDRIRTLLPDVDATKYKTTESHFDWEKVCFGPFTGDMCKQKWQKVSTEVRKYRTMTELLIDAIEYVKNPYKGKKLKTHPDFPKKPLTPYFRFFMEKRAKYAKIHPEMSNLDLTKILSKKYKELPEKKKLKYIQDFQREKESFEKNMARFKENYPDLIEERKKSDVPEKPKTPQQLWYNHEKKTYLKLHPDVSPKELKDALRRQWSQLSDKKRLKWISKALELQKDFETTMREYHEAHPETNQDEHVKSVLTKAERQLKDKFDGRPTKPPPYDTLTFLSIINRGSALVALPSRGGLSGSLTNGYSLYCAELMITMKDVPSTERMVLCSKQWKIMTQKEKDMFQKRCEQKKKQYEMDLQRFLESLPEEERDRVLMEEKLGSSRMALGNSASPLQAKSTPAKMKLSDVDQTRADQEQRVQSLLKEKRDRKKVVRLPETPKTANEIWQQSVIGDYLAKYRRELIEMRTPLSAQTQRKPKFDGEPKKPPVLKERMVEIGKRWHKLSQSQKNKYKKLVEEQQTEYKAELEAWVKSLSPQERANYKEFSAVKRRNSSKAGGPAAKVRVTEKGKATGVRARAPGLGAGEGKKAVAYRAQDTSDSSEEEKSDSSNSEEDSSGSSDSDEDEDEIALESNIIHPDKNLIQ
ncbi:Nucleolar transcription factor 1 [Acipenser ruthenus]|uniref:Nucleolar transcription factor 1 n=1 Tax=Acipenser ruthenus TaxID=7906 RepID=A0A444UB78_ACIRT|nr:Nucleolar transcription factor 1 [Acipenser ruthenus]